MYTSGNYAAYSDSGMHAAAHESRRTRPDARRRSSSRKLASASARDRRAIVSWLIVAAFCLLFSIVYAQFSHGVSSPYMTWLAAIPLVCGAGVFALWRLLRLKPVGGWGYVAYTCAVATLTVGSCLRGIFEIAGTSSSYLVVFGVASIVLVMFAGISAAYAQLRG